MLTVAVTGATGAQGGATARSLLPAGRSVPYEEVPLACARPRSTDLAAMFAYFTTTGLDVDVAGLRREFPEVGWQGFDDWARTQDWSTTLAGEPAPSPH